VFQVPKQKQVNENWRKLHNEKLQNFCRPDILMMIKSRIY